MKRIAFCSSAKNACIDYDPYGMLLQQWMKANGEEISLTRYTLRAENGSKALEALSDDHAAEPYDAMVVSGGVSIGFGDEGDECLVWAAPLAAVMQKTQRKVPLLWNAPRVVETLSGWDTGILSRMMNGVDLPALRDDNAAGQWMGDGRTCVCPEPLLLLPVYYPAKEMAKNNPVSFERYLVLEPPEKLTDELREAFAALAQIGLPMVVLSQDSELRTISDEKTDEWTLQEIHAAVAGCSLYIGCGENAVIACAYGKNILVPEGTADGLQKMLEGLVNCTGKTELQEAAKKLLQDPWPSNPEILQTLQERVNGHYAQMLNILRQPKERLDSAAGMLLAVLRGYSAVSGQEKQARRSMEQAWDAFNQRGEYIDNLQRAYDLCESGHQEYQASLKVYTDQVEQQYYRQKDRVYRLQAAIKRVEKERDEAVAKMENSKKPLLGFFKL